MAIKNTSVILALLVSALLSASALAGTFLPMAKKGEVPNPSVLADRIEQSLQSDPLGGAPVKGANINPNGFLDAIQGAGGTVADVRDLPEYLRSLQADTMPSGEVTFSRVEYRPSGNVVDLRNGFARSARKGEKGWYDMNTGKLILAGDCSNSPLVETVVHAPAPVVTYQRPVARPARDPYAGVQRCPGGDPNRRYFQVAMYEPSAAQHTCAIEHMYAHGGRNRGSDPTAWGDPSTNAFSKACGRELHQSQYQLGDNVHEVDITVEENGEEYLLFSGTLQGQRLNPASAEDAKIVGADGEVIFIPEEYTGGRVVVHFKDYSKIRTPVQSGVAYDLSEFGRGCRVMRYTGIELGAGEVAVTE
jgi:hypothetical protein